MKRTMDDDREIVLVRRWVGGLVSMYVCTSIYIYIYIYIYLPTRVDYNDVSTFSYFYVSGFISLVGGGEEWVDGLICILLV